MHNPGVYVHPHSDVLGPNPCSEMLPCQAYIDTDSQMYRHTDAADKQAHPRAAHRKIEMQSYMQTPLSLLPVRNT